MKADEKKARGGLQHYGECMERLCALRVLSRKCAHKSHMVTIMAFMDFALWAAQAAIYVSWEDAVAATED